MIFQYPQPGFHFSVTFELDPQTPADSRFREVSGLKASITTEPASDGGSMAMPELPVKIKYEDLILKRGVFTGSGIRSWCLNAIEKFEFKPANITIMLLGEFHQPVMSWYVVGAYPVSWEVSGFDAGKSELAVESITLKYDHFKTIA